MSEFQRKIEEFFSELGLSGKKIKAFLESGSKDYRSFLIQKGARRLGYQKDLRKSVRHRGLIITGGKVIITSTTPEGEKVVLAQEGDNSQIVFPSEAIEEWLYFGKTAIESPTLAAYHKLFEVVGKNFDFDLEYIGEKTSTIVHVNRDIVYDISMFYKAEIPYKEMLKIEGNGKWKIFPLSQFELGSEIQSFI